MCKCLKRLTVVFTCILCLTLSDAAAYGAGSEIVDTEVSYQPGEPAGWPALELELSARGGGYVLDGNARIEEGIVTYTLRQGEEKNFQFVARQKYRLQSLTQNGVSVLSSLNEKNELTVTMPAEKQRIEVAFVIKDDIPNGNMNSENVKTDGIWGNGIKTGDWQNNLHWVNPLILCILLTLWGMLVRRKQ